VPSAAEHWQYVVGVTVMAGMSGTSFLAAVTMPAESAAAARFWAPYWIPARAARRVDGDAGSRNVDESEEVEIQHTTHRGIQCEDGIPWNIGSHCPSRHFGGGPPPPSSGRRSAPSG